MPSSKDSSLTLDAFSVPLPGESREDTWEDRTPAGLKAL